MSDNAAKSFHLNWVLYGSALGVAVAAASYFGIVSEFKSELIQLVSLATAFLFAGILTGYLSDGVVMKESAVAGFVVALATMALILLFPGKIVLSPVSIGLGLVGGIGLTFAGAWAGEQIQGDHGVLDNDYKIAGVRWKWVAVGIILGFSLNILFSIIFAPIYGKSLDIAFYMFCFSTLLMGVSVAIFSPGVTIAEPAMAGVVAVFLEWLLVEFVMELHVETTNLLIGLGLGFVLTLVGSFVGEKLQKN